MKVCFQTSWACPEEGQIDLLVVFRAGEKTFDNFMDLKFYLEYNLNKDIDLVTNDDLKEELKADILGSAKYAEA